MHTFLSILALFVSFHGLVFAILAVAFTHKVILKSSRGKDWVSKSYLIAKFIGFYLYGVAIFNIGLKDQTPSAYFAVLAFWIGIILLLESTVIDGEYDYSLTRIVTSLFTSVYFVLGLVLFSAFLFMTIFYPMGLADTKLEVAKANVSEKSLEATNEKELPVVGDHYAEYVAKRKLSSWKKNSSYFTLGKGIKQSIKGKLYYAFPIEYRGFSKWLKGQNIPGYILVNAENPNAKARFVASEMKYVPSAYFGDNVKRMVRKEHPTSVLMDISFEVDDNEKPYYVVPYGHYDAYRDVRIVDGAVLVDPKTGKQKDYKAKDVPAFVDQIIPTDIAQERMEWYGAFRQGGWWNAYGFILSSQTGVVEPTKWGDKDGVVGLYNNQKELMWFSDFTNPMSGSDAMVGFATMDARTGKIMYYDGIDGLSGKDAKDVSSKGALKAEDLKGNVRGLFIILNQPTWLVSLEDKKHVYRYTAFVNVNDTQVYAYAKNTDEALDNYQTAIADSGNSTDASATKDVEIGKIDGRVVAVYKKEVKDKTNVQFILDNSDKIFTVTTEQYPYAMFIDKGDIVSVQYFDTKLTKVSVKEFKDTTINK